MSLSNNNGEEESFIVLGSSSPHLSLQADPGSMPVFGPNAVRIDDVLAELSMEGGLAYKAHFHLSDNPSPSSMMVANSIVTEDRSTGELQKKFGELLDENLILKETLKQNNESIKEQFLLIASCQEDMMKTHKIHKEKFEETKELIERLRAENRKFKQDMKQLSESQKSSLQTSQPTSVNGTPELTDDQKVTSSVYEFVASPDEDTLNKLTSQLNLVERQRRQVIVQNEKLTWQKESLEHIVDVTTKERDDLKDKLKGIELEYSNRESEHINEIRSLKTAAKDMQAKLHHAESFANLAEEVLKRDNAIHILESKVLGLQSELKNSQLKIFELESLKLELSRLRHGAAETTRIYKEQVQELQGRLKEAQTTVFQPIRFSISTESDVQNSEYSSFKDAVKLYDKSLKHLADLLNSITSGASESLSRVLSLAIELNEIKVDQRAPESIRSAVLEMKTHVEQQHTAALNNVGQVRAIISIFEKIFLDYKEVLKKLITATGANEATASKTSMSSASIDALTAALVSRDQELTNNAQELSRLRTLVAMLQKESEERDLLRAQLDVYKNDFNQERESRMKLASDKESTLQELRGMQRHNQDLVEQLEAIRKLNPNMVATVKRAHVPAPFTMVYTCPKCQAFSCDQYKMIEDHVEKCLDT